jgi:hypothetical protein
VSQRESDGLSDILGRRGANSGSQRLLRRSRGSVIVVIKRSVDVGIRVLNAEEKKRKTGRETGARRFLRFVFSLLHLGEVLVVHRLLLLAECRILRPRTIFLHLLQDCLSVRR